MRIKPQIEQGKIRRGDQMPCPQCGKKFVGFDVGTGIVYLCPRCKTPDQFADELHHLTFREVGMNNTLTDKKSGRVLLRYKVDDERRLVLYSLPEPDNPRSRDALFGLTLSFQMANMGDMGSMGIGGYEILDVDEHRRDIVTTKFYAVKRMIADWRKAHPDEVNCE